MYYICNFVCLILSIDWPVKPHLPLILGHEGIGRIVELGADVDCEKYHLKLGDIIGIQWLQGVCLQCEFCLNGRETYCNQKVKTGWTKVCHLFPLISTKLYKCFLGWRLC
jgi:propanol-preferring alcohol dehydrogenase